MRSFPSYKLLLNASPVNYTSAFASFCDSQPGWMVRATFDGATLRWKFEWQTRDYRAIASTFLDHLVQLILLSNKSNNITKINKYASGHTSINNRISIHVWTWDHNFITMFTRHAFQTIIASRMCLVRDLIRDYNHQFNQVVNSKKFN